MLVVVEVVVVVVVMVVVVVLLLLLVAVQRNDLVMTQVRNKQQNFGGHTQLPDW